MRDAKSKKCSFRAKNYGSFKALAEFLGIPPNYVCYGKTINGVKVEPPLTEVKINKRMARELISHYAKNNKILVDKIKSNKQMIRKLVKVLYSQE